MAKVSSETGGWFSIFQEGPITWMAPRGIGGGRPLLSTHFLGPCLWLRLLTRYRQAVCTRRVYRSRLHNLHTQYTFSFHTVHAYVKLYRQNCSQFSQCCISQSSKAAKIEIIATLSPQNTCTITLKYVNHQISMYNLAHVSCDYNLAIIWILKF